MGDTLEGSAAPVVHSLKHIFASTVSLSFSHLPFLPSLYRLENLFLKALIVLAIMGAIFLTCGLSLELWPPPLLRPPPEGRGGSGGLLLDDEAGSGGGL